MKMTKREFAEAVVKELESRNMEAEIRDVPKDNSILWTGITIGSTSVRPTIYIEPFYERDYDASTVADKIEKIASEATSFSDIPQEVTEAFHGNMDFSKVHPRIVNYAKNVNKLESIPYVKVNDLAVYFCLMVPFAIGDDSYGSVEITNKMAEVNGVSAADLLKYATDNIKRNVLVEPIGQVVDELMGGSDETNMDDTMSVVTNTDRLYGAAAVFLIKEILVQYSAKHNNTDVAIIPSSVHECLILSLQAEDDIDMLSDMVQSVNSDQVDEKEQLSDHVYIFRAKSGKIEVA